MNENETPLPTNSLPVIQPTESFAVDPTALAAHIAAPQRDDETRDNELDSVKAELSALKADLEAVKEKVEKHESDLSKLIGKLFHPSQWGK